MFGGKRASQLTIADIEQLCADEWPESDFLELKRQPSGRGGAGKDDPWRERRTLSESARNKILEEIVAFANASGGWLLIGIAETDTQPHRAKAITPLPDCSDLAHRLRMACRDCIEPPLPSIEIYGVAEDGSDDGTVVAYVAKSRAAPHRLTPTRDCYIRRQDRTEKMTMREIQDLTINLARGSASIEAALDAASAELTALVKAVWGYQDLSRFHDVYDDDDVRHFGGAFGFRATAMPVTEIYLDTLDHALDRFMPLKDVSAVSRERPVKLQVPVLGAGAVPLLRGKRLTSNRKREHPHICERDIFRDGKIDYRLAIRPAQHEALYLHASWVLGLCANCLIAIENFRTLAVQPGVEYALQVEIQVEGDEIQVEDHFDNIQRQSWITDHYLGGVVTLPILSVTSREGFSDALALIEQDFFNAAGIDWPRSLNVDFGGLV